MSGVSGDDYKAIRLWLRLRTRFGTTLARFDYMAQLSCYPEGLRMKVLSRYLMVTGSNETGLID